MPTSAATASGLNAATIVRVFNPDGASTHVVTRLASVSGTVLGSVTIAPNEEIYLFKDPADCLYTDASVRAVPVAFIN